MSELPIGKMVFGPADPLPVGGKSMLVDVIRERDEAVAACASFRQVAEVVYEWCNSDSPSDISSDWVKEKLDATDIGKAFLEDHKRLEANVIKWGPLVESYELENLQLRAVLKQCVRALEEVRGLIADFQLVGSKTVVEDNEAQERINASVKLCSEALASSKPLLERSGSQIV
jgi:hypothetical protein